MTSLDQKARNVGDYYYIFICTITEQSSDQEEIKSKHENGSQYNVNGALWQIK
jgi:flagellar basal body L-ring protein FlgH